MSNTEFSSALVAAMARRCGLEDPDAFATKGGVWSSRPLLRGLASNPDRGTGRTTRTLLQALVALEAGCSVEVVAADPDQAKDLRGRFAKLRDALSGDATMGSEPAFTCTPIGDGRDADLRLVDHYAAERMVCPAHERVFGPEPRIGGLVPINPVRFDFVVP